TSGSMADDNKIDQARRALKYCVSQLHAGDRFGLIRFSTEVDTFKSGIIEASKENIESARKWVDDLTASGGTNIDGALDQAAKMQPEREKKTGEGTPAVARPFTIVFITDGQPTIGKTDPDGILADFKRRSTGDIRVFTFGVGHDVNTKLLDKLADDT